MQTCREIMGEIPGQVAAEQALYLEELAEGEKRGVFLPAGTHAAAVFEFSELEQRAAAAGSSESKVFGRLVLACWMTDQ